MEKITYKNFKNYFRKFFSIYGASATSLLFTLAILPKLHSNLSIKEWIGFSIFISASSFIMVIDLGSNQMLPRSIIGKSDNHISLAITSYRAVCGIVGVVFGVFLFIYIFNYIHPSLFRGSIQRIFIGIIGCFWVVFSFYNNLYITAMQGLRLNSLYVRIAIVSISIRTLGIMLLMYLNIISLDLIILIYFLCSIIENIFYKIALCKYIKFLFFDFKYGLKILKNWNFLRSALFISSGAWLSQFDRLILIKNLNLEDYSKYIWISSFCLLFLMAQYPLLRYLMPRMNEVKYLFKKNIKKIVFYYCFFGTLFIYYSPTIFTIWSGHQIEVKLISSIRILITGIFIHSIYNFGYQQMIVDGAYKGIFLTNLLSLFFVLLISFFMPKNINLGGWIWVIFSSCQLLCFFSYIKLNFLRSWLCTSNNYFMFKI